MNRALATFALETMRFVRARVPIPRRQRVFGQDIRLTPNTIFPNHWRYRLPRGSGRPAAVRYTDYVQFCSNCDYLAGLDHPPVVIDVGAYHGAYAVTLGMFCRPDGRLIAVEPDTESFRILERNIKLNHLGSIVSAERVAVSDVEGTSGFRSHGSHSQMVKDGATTTVRTLRSIISRLGINHVDLLMIDIEGAELLALRGYPWESVTFGRIMCELHPYNWGLYGHGWTEFHALLSERGLCCLDMYLRDIRSVKSSQKYVGPCLMWRP